ncbi:uncharacterized protein [Elaeis guineensis]|uniref:uncharacterized protein isoform X2 n=1 Tax=Elaeis guineensis var. tenera TaxID=51953 RepID=UPI003C6D6A9B
MRSEDQPSRVLYELCSLLLSVLRSPHLAGPEMPPPQPLPARASRAVAEPRLARWPRPQLSPTGLASLLLGMSLAMMFCGSVTFAIGFILMPWVLGMMMVLGFMGIVSNLSGLGRAILCLGFPSAAEASSNEVPGWLQKRNVVYPCWIDYRLIHHLNPIMMSHSNNHFQHIILSHIDSVRDHIILATVIRCCRYFESVNF